MLLPIIEHRQPNPKVEALLRLLILISSTGVFMYVVVNIIGNFICFKLFGTSYVNIDLDGELTSLEIQTYKLTQLFYQVGAFLLPPLFVAMVMRKSPGRLYSLEKKAFRRVMWVFLPMLLFFAALASSHLVEIISWIEWPSVLLESESLSMKLMDTLLATSGGLGWLVNLLIFAVMPALVEEIYFRGCLQRIFGQLFRNHHVAISMGAIVFALIHGQATGILAFTFMGLVLGYLYHITTNLWYPIVFHFFNNGISLLLDGLYRQGHLQTDPNDIVLPPAIGWAALLLTIGALVMLGKYWDRVSVRVKLDTAQEAWVKVFASSDLLKIQMVNDSLARDGYDVMIVNKKDSSYGFGEAEVHVPYHQYESARAFIDQSS